LDVRIGEIGDKGGEIDPREHGFGEECVPVLLNGINTGLTIGIVAQREGKPGRVVDGGFFDTGCFDIRVP
jgi:hypothetical protein